MSLYVRSQGIAEHLGKQMIQSLMRRLMPFLIQIDVLASITTLWQPCNNDETTNFTGNVGYCDTWYSAKDFRVHMSASHLKWLLRWQLRYLYAHIPNNLAVNFWSWKLISVYFCFLNVCVVVADFDGDIVLQVILWKAPRFGLEHTSEAHFKSSVFCCCCCYTQIWFGLIVWTQCM